MKIIGAVYYLKPTQNQSIQDLPASTSAPAEIIGTGEKTIQVDAYVAVDFYYTWAIDAAQGATRIAADITRCKLPAGHVKFDLNGNNTLNLYIRSQGAISVGGLSTNFYEFG